MNALIRLEVKKIIKQRWIFFFLMLAIILPFALQWFTIKRQNEYVGKYYEDLTYERQLFEMSARLLKDIKEGRNQDLKEDEYRVKYQLIEKILMVSERRNEVLIEGDLRAFVQIEEELIRLKDQANGMLKSHSYPVEPFWKAQIEQLHRENLLFEDEELGISGWMSVYRTLSLTAGWAGICLLMLLMTYHFSVEEKNESLLTLLVTPFSRTAVMAAKLISVFIALLSFLGISFLSALLAGPVLGSGWGSLFYPLMGFRELEKVVIPLYQVILGQTMGFLLFVLFGMGLFLLLSYVVREPVPVFLGSMLYLLIGYMPENPRLMDGGGFVEGWRLLNPVKALDMGYYVQQGDWVPLWPWLLTAILLTLAIFLWSGIQVLKRDFVGFPPTQTRRSDLYWWRFPLRQLLRSEWIRVGTVTLLLLCVGTSFGYAHFVQQKVSDFEKLITEMIPYTVDQTSKRLESQLEEWRALLSSGEEDVGTLKSEITRTEGLLVGKETEVRSIQRLEEAYRNNDSQVFYTEAQKWTSFLYGKTNLLSVFSWTDMVAEKGLSSQMSYQAALQSNRIREEQKIEPLPMPFYVITREDQPDNLLHWLKWQRDYQSVLPQGTDAIHRLSHWGGFHVLGISIALLFTSAERDLHKGLLFTRPISRTRLRLELAVIEGLFATLFFIGATGLLFAVSSLLFKSVGHFHLPTLVYTVGEPATPFHWVPYREMVAPGALLFFGIFLFFMSGLRWMGRILQDRLMALFAWTSISFVGYRVFATGKLQTIAPWVPFTYLKGVNIVNRELAANLENPMIYWAVGVVVLLIGSIVLWTGAVKE